MPEKIRVPLSEAKKMSEQELNELGPVLRIRLAEDLGMLEHVEQHKRYLRQKGREQAKALHEELRNA